MYPGIILSAGSASSWFIEGLGFKELLKGRDVYEVLLTYALGDCFGIFKKLGVKSGG